jgi:hypothetical protein
MRSLLTIVLGSFVLFGAGCKNFKFGGDWSTTNNNTVKASGVNVYNCSDAHQIEVFRRPVGNGNDWTYINATGSTGDESECPDDSDWPIFVDLSDGDFQIRLNFYGVSSTCAGNDPEGDCSRKDKSFEGDEDGEVVDWVWTN